MRAARAAHGADLGLPAEHAWGDRTVRELTGHGVDCSRRAPASGAAAWASTFSSTGRRRGRCGCSTTGGIPRLPRSCPRTVDWGARPARADGAPHRDHRRPSDRGRADVRPRGRATRPRRRGAISFDVNYRSRLWSAGGGAGLPAGVFPRPRYLFIGADERATVFDLAGSPEATLEALRALAPRATIALTLGRGGLGGPGRRGHGAAVQRYDGQVVDRVGAGDAYAAGFLWATLNGRPAAGGGGCRHRPGRPQVLDLGGRRPVVTRPELEELMAADSTDDPPLSVRADVQEAARRNRSDPRRPQRRRSGGRHARGRAAAHHRRARGRARPPSSPAASPS